MRKFYLEQKAGTVPLLVHASRGFLEWKEFEAFFLGPPFCFRSSRFRNRRWMRAFGRPS